MQGMKTRSPPKERYIMGPRARSLSPVEDRGNSIIQFFMNDKGILHFKLNHLNACMLASQNGNEGSLVSG